METKPGVFKQIFLVPLLDDLCENFFSRIYHSLMIIRKILLIIFMISIGEAYIQIFLILILQMACLMYTILAKPFKYQKSYLCAVGGEISLTATSVLITKLFDKPFGFGGGILNDYNEIALIIICVNGAVLLSMLIINIIVDYMLCFQFFQPTKIGIQFTLGEQKRKGKFVYNSDNVQLSFEDDKEKHKQLNASIKLVDISKSGFLPNYEENKEIAIAQFDNIGIDKNIHWTKKKTMGVNKDEMNRSGVQNTKDPSSKEDHHSNDVQNIDLEDSSASMMHFKKTLSSIWIDRETGSEKNKQSTPIVIKVNDHYKSEDKGSMKSSKIEPIIQEDEKEGLESKELEEVENSKVKEKIDDMIKNAEELLSSKEDQKNNFETSKIVQQKAEFENTRESSKMFKSKSIIDHAKIMKLIDEPLKQNNAMPAVPEEVGTPKRDNLFDKTDKIAAQNAINIRVDTSNEEVVHDEQESSSFEENIDNIVKENSSLDLKAEERMTPIENLRVEVKQEDIDSLQKDMKKLDMSKIMDNPNNINLNIGEDIFGSDPEQESSDEELKGDKKKTKKKTKKSKKPKKVIEGDPEENDKADPQNAKKTKKVKKKTAKGLALEDEEELEPIDISRRKNKANKKDDKDSKAVKDKAKSKPKEPKKQLNHDEQAFAELMNKKASKEK